MYNSSNKNTIYQNACPLYCKHAGEQGNQWRQFSGDHAPSSLAEAGQSQMSHLGNLCLSLRTLTAVGLLVSLPPSSRQTQCSHRPHVHELAPVEIKNKRRNTNAIFLNVDIFTSRQTIQVVYLPNASFCTVQSELRRGNPTGVCVKCSRGCSSCCCCCLASFSSTSRCSSRVSRFEELGGNFKAEYHAGGATQNSIRVAQVGVAPHHLLSGGARDVFLLVLQWV